MHFKRNCFIKKASNDNEHKKGAKLWTKNTYVVLKILTILGPVGFSADDSPVQPYIYDDPLKAWW